MSTALKALRAQSVGATPVVLTVGGAQYTAPSVTTGVVCFDLTISNILNGPSITVTAQIKNGATVTNWIVNALVMQGGAINLCELKPKVLASGDQIIVSANVPNAFDVTGSVSEIT